MKKLKKEYKTNVERLEYIMKCLRDPKTGCPWDIKQTFDTIAPYTIEEAYEVLDAIEQKDMHSLKEELGDLLLQVIFHSQMASENGDFNFDSVAETVCDKMVRRHPHVFETIDSLDVNEQMLAWEDLKAEERSKKTHYNSILDGIAKCLPALLRASKLQKRAARVGFDWPDWKEAYKKLNEELNELSVELEQPNLNKKNIMEELGDVLFSVVNVARKLNIEPEEALRNGNAKFENRFSYIETSLEEDNKSFDDVTLDDMEILWQKSKLMKNL